MTTFRRQVLIKGFKLFDLLIVSLSFLLTMTAASFQFGQVSFGQFLSMRVKIGNFLIFIGFLLLWHCIFSFFELYKQRCLLIQRREFIDIVKGTTVGTALLSLFTFIFSFEMVTPVFIAAFWALTISNTVFGRSLLRMALKKLSITHNETRHLLIVGTNQKAVEFSRKIENSPLGGYSIVGFVDDEWAELKEFKATGYPFLGGLREVAEILRERVVDEVVVFLSLKSFYHQISRIVALSEEQGIVVKYLYSLCETKLAHAKPEQFEGESSISLYTKTMDGWPVVVKRMLDFILSLAMIIILLPVFVAAALLIKLTSPGPVFFVQERVGYNKRRFKLYKFRTMVPGAEKKQKELEQLNEMSGPVFKIGKDPRITPIGKFLRKTSVDELPQIFNVLKGDMSIVGPRPLPVRDYEGFDQDWHRRRFSVYPGITCLWQINGRNQISFEEWMKLDMEYIDNWSLGLDLIILAKTIPAVLKGSGAT